MFISISSSSHCQKVVIYIKSGDQHLLHFFSLSCYYSKPSGKKREEEGRKGKRKVKQTDLFFTRFQSSHLNIHH